MDLASIARSRADGQAVRSGQVRGVEEDTSALSSRRSCQARSARSAPRTTCIATATPAKAIPSLSPKLSRRLGGGGGGRWWWWWWWWCGGWCGGAGAPSESDATRRGGARSGAGLDGGGGEAAAEKERDGEDRRRTGRRSVRVAARRGGRGAVGAMGALAA